MAFWANPALWGGIAAGAGSLLSGILGQNSAKDQMSFQERMRNTSHQAEVDDLKKAGLNPIISAHGGAATPGGAMSTFENFIGAGVSTAMQSKELGSKLDVNDAVKDAQKAAAMRDATTAKQIGTQTKVLEKQMGAIEAEAKRDKAQADWDMKLMNPRNVNRTIQEGLGTLNSAKDVLLRNPGNGVPIGGQTREKWKNRDEMQEDKRQEMFRDAEKLFKKK